MKIHEYQAKKIFKQFGLPVTDGKVFESLDGVEEYARSLNDKVVVKAQIHAGGRGKGGGVKLADTPEEALEIAKKILGMNLVTHQTGPEGKEVKKILLTPAVDIASEFYLAITLDRESECPFLIASTEGGVDIEGVAEKTPEKIYKLKIDPAVGTWPYLGRKIATALELKGKPARIVAALAENLYKMFLETDCSLAEINPLVLTDDQQILAIDGKVDFDDNAMFRHPKLVELRDFSEEEPLEVEASSYNLNYIKLDGNVACMVNGAGLAMATMDTIKLSGGEPANFLDVGGTANAERVEQAFKILLSDPNVKGVLINIFGGIVRCDLVAQGVTEAVSRLGNISQPIVVRLSGTNAEEGKKILKDSGLSFQLADSLDEAAKKIVEAVS